MASQTWRVDDSHPSICRTDSYSLFNIIDASLLSLKIFLASCFAFLKEVSSNLHLSVEMRKHVAEMCCSFRFQGVPLE
eukprot:m.193579 g.193579  ORF g.193579 m.193579 type:complete len:78 (-) comp53686_c5_seq31:215-448(-)